MLNMDLRACLLLRMGAAAERRLVDELHEFGGKA